MKNNQEKSRMVCEFGSVRCEYIAKTPEEIERLSEIIGYAKTAEKHKKVTAFDILTYAQASGLGEVVAVELRKSARKVRTRSLINGVAGATLCALAANTDPALYKGALYLVGTGAMLKGAWDYSYARYFI